MCAQTPSPICQDGPVKRQAARALCTWIDQGEDIMRFGGEPREEEDDGREREKRNGCDDHHHTRRRRCVDVRSSSRRLKDDVNASHS